MASQASQSSPQGVRLWRGHPSRVAFIRQPPAPLAVVWLGCTGAPHSGPVSQEDPQGVGLCDVPPAGYMGICGIQGRTREDSTPTDSLGVGFLGEEPSAYRDAAS